MANIYRSTDAGAPGYTARAPFNNAKSMMQIIKACLVTGYGSKNGAGWSLVYEDTTTGKHRFAISNGNGTVEFVTWGNYGIAVFIWQSITTPGVGRLQTDPWTSVISTGVNGVSAQGAPLPGTDANMVVCIWADYWDTTFGADSAWTIFADERSFWLAMHYPSSNAAGKPGVAIDLANNRHTTLFCGAVKSADLEPDEPGNFFVFYSDHRAGNGAPSYSQVYPRYVMGLKSPTNVIPAANISVESFGISSDYSANPYSSVRAILPYLMAYDGADKPVPPGLSTNRDKYLFATLPGIAKFGDPDGPHNFWAHYTGIHGVSALHEIHVFNGKPWFPYALSSSGNDGLTTDAEWWV